MTTTSPDPIPVVYASRIDPNEGAEARLAHAHRENGRITTELPRVREELRLLKDEMNVVADIGEKDVNTICDLRAELDKAHADRDAALRTVSSFVADDPLGAQSERVMAENAALRTELAKLRLSCATDWKGECDKLRLEIRAYQADLDRSCGEVFRLSDETRTLAGLNGNMVEDAEAMRLQLQSHDKRWARVRELGRELRTCADKESQSMSGELAASIIYAVIGSYADILSSEPEAVAVEAEDPATVEPCRAVVTVDDIESHLVAGGELLINDCPHLRIRRVDGKHQMRNVNDKWGWYYYQDGRPEDPSRYTLLPLEPQQPAPVAVLGEVVSRSIRIKPINSAAKVPTYAHHGDAGADLYAPLEATIRPGERKLIWLDLMLELPWDLEGQIRPRSSMIKRGIFSSVCTIDSGYRGNIGIVLWNTTDEVQPIAEGERIAQLVVSPYVRAEFAVVDELSASDRASGGFGSSGK